MVELEKIQGYVATTSVGASTVRGYEAGTVLACRVFLKALDLSSLSPIKTSAHFATWLDEHTEELRKQLPNQKRFDDYYGIARKVLNIYLHNCYYNRFLASHYGLRRMESYLEVPIDSHVARGLKREAASFSIKVPEEISRWSNIKSLRTNTHTQFQTLASGVAAKLGTKRVHLDAYFYRHE